jgi:hypothetical protein
MMATEYTPNYNLDLYASADKPNLRDQYNAAMGKIDTQMKKSAEDVTNANANVLTLQTQMTGAQKDISALESTVKTHGTQITAVKKTADDAYSLAQTNEGNIADTKADVTSLTGRVTTVEGTANKNKTDIASLGTRMGKAEGNITEAQNDIDGLQTAVDGKAPTNHASTANTYGQGSPTNFGHLKVADSGSAAASSGTAASPKMVTDQINALKSALAPTDLIAATTVNYSGGISGSGTFSVYANSFTKVVSVQLANKSLTTSGSGGWKSTVLGTIPAGYRPTRLMTQNCFSGWGFLYVDTNGQVRLEVSDDISHSAGNKNGCALVYFGSK